MIACCSPRAAVLVLAALFRRLAGEKIAGLGWRIRRPTASHGNLSAENAEPHALGGKERRAADNVRRRDPAPYMD